jgi:predicted nucleic acid-binding protein
VIIVDSSVWIDFFNKVENPATNKLRAVLGRQPVGVGDLILAEVLQGFRKDRDHARARDALLSLDVFDMLGTAAALEAAESYRTLRKKGLTVRKTTDAIIATFCIRHGHRLLHSDRDFAPFVEHLGLLVA